MSKITDEGTRKGCLHENLDKLLSIVVNLKKLWVFFQDVSNNLHLYYTLPSFLKPKL